MALNDRITQYNNNHKGFSFTSTSKPVVLKSIIKSIKKKIINWETSITATNLNQKNAHYIKKKKNQKKRAK